MLEINSQVPFKILTTSKLDFKAAQQCQPQPYFYKVQLNFHFKPLSREYKLLTLFSLFLSFFLSPW
jgi:hypothetical protein